MNFIRRLIHLYEDIRDARKLRAALIELTSVHGRKYNELASGTNAALIRAAKVAYLHDRHPDDSHLKDVITVDALADRLSGKLIGFGRLITFQRVGDAWTFRVSGDFHSLEHIENSIATFTDALDKAVSVAKIGSVDTDTHKPENN